MVLPHVELTALAKAIGYPGLFAIVFAESGLFFGFFLPGASMLFTAGILASQGYFNIWVLVPLLAAAAILGDNVGYWFGAKVGHAFFERKGSRWFRPSHVRAARDFYEKHGVLAIIFARFVPVIRTFAPIVAGIVEMNYRTFLTFNIIGGLVWGSGTAFAGYYIGERVPFISQHLGAVMLAIVIVTTAPLIWEMSKKKHWV